MPKGATTSGSLRGGGRGHQGPPVAQQLPLNSPQGVPPTPKAALQWFGMQQASAYLTAFMKSNGFVATWTKKILGYGTLAAGILAGGNFAAHKGVELTEGLSDRNPGQVPDYFLGKMYYQGGLDWDPKNGSLTAENIEMRTMIGSGAENGPGAYVEKYQKLEREGYPLKDSQGNPLRDKGGQELTRKWVATDAAQKAYKQAQEIIRLSAEQQKESFNKEQELRAAKDVAIQKADADIDAAKTARIAASATLEAAPAQTAASAAAGVAAAQSLESEKQADALEKLARERQRRAVEDVFAPGRSF